MYVVIIVNTSPWQPNMKAGTQWTAGNTDRLTVRSWSFSVFNQHTRHKLSIFQQTLEKKSIFDHFCGNFWDFYRLRFCDGNLKWKFPQTGIKAPKPPCEVMKRSETFSFTCFINNERNKWSGACLSTVMKANVFSICQDFHSKISLVWIRGWITC